MSGPKSSGPIPSPLCVHRRHLLTGLSPSSLIIPLHSTAGDRGHHRSHQGTHTGWSNSAVLAVRLGSAPSFTLLCQAEAHCMTIPVAWVPDDSLRKDRVSHGLP